MGQKWGRLLGGRGAPSVDPAFVEFVAARSAALFRTAVLITGDRHAAEDLVQSALERAFRNWERVSSVDAPEAYVRRILANLANDHLRERGRAGIELLDHDGQGGHDGPAGHDRPAADPFQRVDEHDAVIRALREVPVRMRTVLVLRYFDDMTEAQIAEALGIAPGTVKSQAARGLAKLRAALTGDESVGRGAASAADSGGTSTTAIQFPQGGAA